MSNSGFGIASVVLGGLSIFFFGSGLAFILIAAAFVCAFIGMTDPKKYKWSGIVGASLAGFAMLLCCINIMIKTGPGSSLIRKGGIPGEEEDWDDEDWDEEDWDDEDWDDDDWEEDDSDDEDWDTDSYDQDSVTPGSGSSSSGSNSSTGTSNGSSDDYSYSSSSASDDDDDEEDYDEDKVYKLGDIWTVPGQWRFTILKVEPTTFRDELPETDSGAVYYIYYRYENLGYVDPDGVWDGLYFDLSSADITDKEGYMGYSYPGEVENYATEAPIGGYAEGVSCIGLETAGDFTIVVDKYDGKDEYREATFEIKVN